MRTDDFKNAIVLAKADLAKRKAQETAELSGAALEGGNLALKFLGRGALVDAATYDVRWADQREGEDFALTDAVMLLHYLQGAKGVGPTGEIVAYRQIPGGEFYTAAFRKRAEIPLIKTFGHKPGLLLKAAEKLGGAPREGLGDEGAIFRVLPNIDVLTVIHHGDEEFDPDGQVLFDKSVSHAVSIEDVAWLGSAVVYRLMGLARQVA
ncbi:MAG: DUF3786 domain-containing protein [Deltaproteobacteria bacterium]|nr:DUF3786 domain-containing protein [Deltaproteobacteria bacterium]